jgi:hypothetical protein
LKGVKLRLSEAEAEAELGLSDSWKPIDGVKRYGCDANQIV